MKVIHFILMLLIPCLGLAGGEGSGGSLTQKAFLEMGPELALASNKFRKRIYSIHLPGTSTWYNPANEICIEGNNVRTIRPKRSCSVWFVDLKESEHGKKTLTFDSYQRAKDKAESRNGRGKPYCTDEYATFNYIQVPLSQIHTTFDVEFFEKVHSGDRYDRDHFLGTHEYFIPLCHEVDTVTGDLLIRTADGDSGVQLKLQSL